MEQKKTYPPVPAPRRIYPELPKSDYENVTIDINKKLNINTENLQNNKKVTDKLPNNKVFIVVPKEDSNRLNNNNDMNYSRVILTETNDLYGPNANAEVPDILPGIQMTPATPTAPTTPSKDMPIYAKPTPAPRPRPIVSPTDIYDSPLPSPVGSSPQTGAVSKDPTMLRKAPDIPPKINRSQQRHSITSECSTTSSRNANETVTFANSTFFGSDNLKKSGSNITINSSDSSENSKFKSPSPGEILKSLGATSKLLSESIGERVANKAKDARHKFDKNLKASGEVISNISMETTNRIKRLGNNLTLTKKDKTKDKENMPGAPYDTDRPQTLPPNDQVFNSITFSSPLQRTAVGLEDLRTNELEESYDMPRHLKSVASTSDISAPPPPYEYVVISKQTHTFDRNSASSRSVMVPKHIAAEAAKVALAKQNSNPNLTNISAQQSSSRDSIDIPSLPMPSFPPPALPAGFKDAEDTYGKLNPIKPERVKRRKNYEQIELRRTVDSPVSGNSIRPNIDSAELHQLNLEADAAERKESLLLREQTKAAEQCIPMPERCTSWEYTEDSHADSDNDNSSPEPMYANQEITYGRVFEMSTSNNDLLPCADISEQRNLEMAEGAVGGVVKPTKDIIYEFDPLRQKNLPIPTNKSNQLLLLEHMLEEDVYGSVAVGATSKSDDDVSMCTSEEDNNNVASGTTPPTPSTPTTPSANSTLSLGARQLQIVHQNAQLLSDSMENMIDDDTESRVKPFLSRVDERHNGNESVDLSRPSQNRTNWFIQEGIQQTDVQPRINPFNKLNIEDGESPPSYLEAIGADGKPTFPQNEQKSVATRIKNSMNVFSKERIRDALKRKTSIKASQRSSDVRITLQMVPRPTLSPLLVRYEGQLVRFPSGVVEDILKEMQNRRAILRDRQFQTYLDHEMKTPKEMIPLEYITTIQCVSNNRVTDSSTQFYCFEITTTIPKNTGSGSNSSSSSNIQAMSNPNLVMTSGTSGNCKHQRVTHLYGVIKESERDIWMQKLLESLTDCVPSKYNCHYYRAGWCYLKNSISSEWTGTWLVLKKSYRRLVFVSEPLLNTERMDLRKARCIVLKESDESVDNLHVEKGPIMMIDCPPFTVYMIMSSPRETKTWRHIIREVAHNNGFMLNEHQLTKYNVPVIVDKCINFIYIHGSMSEGIYRKSGAENAISKLMSAFRADAFNVEITRNEYNEHDVANVLKRFMRDLPERLLGKLSESFICVSELSNLRDKIPIYKELLGRLGIIERETLKKIVCHLSFINSQSAKNKMSIPNLCLIWGPTLLKTDQMEYSKKEADVLVDLIKLEKDLFPLSADEIKREQEMLLCLKKYYAASERLTDTVKQSGDLKMWITINPNPDNENEEKTQINVTISPTKTAYELCKELSQKMGMAAHEFCVFEIILNGSLERPLHYDTKIFDVVLNWSYWPEDDRKDNCLAVKPLGVLKEVQRVVRNTAIVTPSKDLKFADNRTKSFKNLLCELRDGKIVISKKDKNDKMTIVREIFLHSTTAYLGMEKKRDSANGSWAITFVERTQTQILRSRDAPFIGHVLTSGQWVDRIIWYSSIWFCLHGDNILPPAELIFK